MKKALISLSVAAALAALVGCQDPATSSKASVEAAQNATSSQQATQLSFTDFSQRFIDDLWLLAPTWAMYNGKHINDGYLDVPNQASREKPSHLLPSKRAY